MLAFEFPGSLQLVESLTSAVDAHSKGEFANAVRSRLRELIYDPSVELPAVCYAITSGRYARRELYRSEDLGFSLIAMTWGPGHGTPIHDHAGMWCVEGVWRGSLEITGYELMEQRVGRYRFESRGMLVAHRGSTCSLAPPNDYHAIHNASRNTVAVTIHVYGGAMTQCSIFRKIKDGWYGCDQRLLSLDGIP